MRSVMRMKSMPSTKRTANACCHVNPIAWQSVKAKKAFNPMLGACANGSLDMKASNTVATPAATAVPVKRAALSIPVVERMAGLTAKM